MPECHDTQMGPMLSALNVAVEIGRGLGIVRPTGFVEEMEGLFFRYASTLLAGLLKVKTSSPLLPSSLDHNTQNLFLLRHSSCSTGSWAWRWPCRRRPSTRSSTRS